MPTPQSTHLPDLPPEVEALARRCGAEGFAEARSVALRQIGSMRADAAHAWAPFRARQVMALDQPGFAWRAKTGPLGLVRITDALEETGGRLTVRALGLLPLVRVVSDAALTKGQLMRYLAELPLAPDAIIRNAALEWHIVSETLIRVTARHGDVRAAIELTVGPDGLMTSVFAPDRPRLEGARTVERPWRGHFTDYRQHQGRRLPFAAEIAWTIDDTAVSVWRGRMVDWRLA